MKQTDDHTIYRGRFQALETRESSVIIEHNAKIADVESSIGFHFWLFDEANRMIPIRNISTPLKYYRQIMWGLYLKNSHYLLSSLILAKYGLVNSAYGNLRTVYEDILTTYYLRFFPNEARLLASSFKPKITKKQKQRLRTKGFYSPSFLIDAMYKNAKGNKMRKFYHLISQHSHASLLSANLDSNYNSTVINNCLNGILACTYGSVTSFLEEFVFLFDDTQRSGINESRLRILDSLGLRFDFAPNVDILEKNLRIKGTKILT